MSFIISDRVKETSLTSGTGSVELAGSIGAFQTFELGIGDGNTTYYTIENASNWEVGQGVYNSATNTLDRNIVFDSSNEGEKIHLQGVSVVFCTLPASKAVVQDDSGTTYVTDIVSSGGSITNLSSNNLVASGNAVFGQEVLISGDLSVLSDFIFNGDLNVNNINTSGDISSSGLLTLIRPNSAGSFLHAYKDDGTEQTIGLHVDSNTSPLWKFGLKTNPSNESDPPTFAYIFARDGSAGVVSNTDNYVSISDSLGLTVQHDSNTVFRASSLTGVYLETKSSAYPSFVITGPPLASEDLQRWNKSDDTTLSVVDSGGRFGILKTDPQYELDVNGSGKLDSVYLTDGIYFQDGTFQGTAHTLSRVYENISSDKSMTPLDDVVFADATLSTINVYIPTAAGNGGKELTIKKVAGGNDVVIHASGSQKIDGQSTLAIHYVYESVTLLSNNSNWFIT